MHYSKINFFNLKKNVILLCVWLMTNVIIWPLITESEYVKIMRKELVILLFYYHIVISIFLNTVKTLQIAEKYSKFTR